MKRLYPTLVVAVFIALTCTFWPRARPPIHYLEATIRASAPGLAQFFFDSGSKSSQVAVAGDNKEGVYRFPLPDGRYLNLNLSPTDVAGASFTVSQVRVIDQTGTLIRSIAPERVKTVETSERFTKGLGRDRPMLLVEMRPPLILKSYARPSGRSLLRRFVISFVVGLGLALVATRGLSQMKALYLRLQNKVRVWILERPGRVILVAAAASVILSCYPIVFFGKSFLSPNNHSSAFLLYGEMPTVPGYTETVTDNESGADLGAAIWYSWPVSLVEHRALSKDFELPLWNRYDSCGLPLLGQGQSMFGDPLHMLVLLAQGASWSWDLKYLLAKFLFAAAIGFCVLHLTKHLPSAVIVALSAPFIGFYSYRYSHPAFFTMSYAPLILLCWLKLADRPCSRAWPSWLGLITLANWMVLSSGTVKEAYVLLFAMNLCGALTLLFSRNVTNRMAKLWQATGALLLFALIATPIWLTFLQNLRTSWTVYDTGGVFQLQPGLLIGLFDDIFYRQFNAGERHLDPSANFFVLAAVLWFCFAGRGIDSRRSSWGISLMALLALALVFGVVSPWLILRIPFLDRIYHIDNTFSCVAIVCLLLLAGFGVKAFWNNCRAPDFSSTYRQVLTGLSLLIALYLGTTEAAQRSTQAFLRIGDHIHKSTFFWGYSLVLVGIFALLPWIGRSAVRAGSSLRPWTALLLGLIFVLLHWRLGMHLQTGFDSYVMNPHSRVSLVADSSSAVNFIKGHETEPFRAVGLGYNLFPGYGGAIGVEQIDGADPLLNRYYRTLLDASGIKLPFGSSKEGLLNEPIGNDLPLLNMLNVRYYLGEMIAQPELHPSVRKLGAFDLDVYESSAVWPRAFFVDQLSSYGSETDFISLLQQGDGKPFAAVPRIDLEKQADLRPLLRESPPSPAREIVAATGYALTNNTTSFTVRTPGPGVVVLTEPYVQGDLQVKLDGKATNYFRVNSAFRGVFVPAAGEYHLSFSYWPRNLTVSLWTSAVGLTLLAVWIGKAWRQSHRAT